MLIEIFFYGIIIQVILSWIQPAAPINRVLLQIISPLMRPIQKLIPLIGGFDISPIPALIFLLLEPYNRRKFVRFHAFQSLLFNLAYFVIHVGLRLLPTIGWALSSLVWFLAFVLWIVFVVKASQGQLWKAPIIGDIAEKQAGA